VDLRLSHPIHASASIHPSSVVKTGCGAVFPLTPTLSVRGTSGPPHSLGRVKGQIAPVPAAGRVVGVEEIRWPSNVLRPYLEALT
jgi:hypothetical protein